MVDGNTQHGIENHYQTAEWQWCLAAGQLAAVFVAIHV